MGTADTGSIIAGRYALHRPIGHGGMSSVYLGRDERLGREVAVKLLHPALATDAAFVERFRREAQSAAGLSHPNIAAVYDWGDDGESHFLVMEYVAGSTLKEVILRRGRRPEREALHIAREIAMALEAAHRAGVVHRDVKPQNVLLDLEGGVKVVDFGIARATGESQLTRTGTILGSAHYASPEQIQRHAVDARSDLYSLGAVLYEMLTGRPPFLADSPVAIAWQHVHEAPERPTALAPGLSESGEGLTLRLLQKDPDQRYQTAGDLVADIDSILLGRDPATTQATEPLPVNLTPAPARAVPDSPTIPMAAVRGRRPGSRLPLLALPLVLAALMLPLAFYLVSRRGAPDSLASPAASPTGAAGVAGAVATAAEPTVAPTTPPAPTTAPTTSAPTPAPTARPAVQPTSPPAPTTAPPVLDAAAPVAAVSSFYAAAATGRYGDAAALWSSRMRAQWPPAQFIDLRFAQTQSLTVSSAHVIEQTADRAVVAVDLVEMIGNPPERRRWVGTWTLVRSGSAWLLDAPNLAQG